MVALDFMVVGLLARIGKAGVKAMSSGEKLARSAAVKASTDAVYEGHKYVGGYTGKEKNVWAEIFGSEVDFLIGCIPTIGTSQSVTNVYFSLEHVFKLKEEYQKKVDEELLLRQKEWRIPGLIIDDLRDLLDNPTYPTEVDDLVQTLRELTPYKNPNEC